MKKTFKSIIAILSLGMLVGCKTTVDAGTTQAVKKEGVLSIKFKKDKYEVEQNTSVSLYVDIEVSDLDKYDKTADFEVVALYGKDLQTEIDIYGKNSLGAYCAINGSTNINKLNNMEGKTNITIKANKGVGKLVIKATACSDRSQSVTTEVFFTPELAAANKVWETLNEKKNYTLNIYSSAEEDPEKPYEIIKATENALTYLKPDGTAFHKFNHYKLDADGKPKDEDGDGKNDIDFTTNCYGVGLTKNGTRATYLEKKLDDDENETGDWLTNQESIQSTWGFLNEETLLGGGNQMSSPNDLGSFFGLQGINPLWLPNNNSAAENHVFTIDGSAADKSDDEKLHNAFVEVILWQLLDYESYKTYMTNATEETLKANPNYLTFTAMSEQIETQIKVLSSDNLEVYLTNKAGVEFTMKIADVGTTTQSESINTFIGTNPVVKDAPLSSDLQLFKNALASESYVEEVKTTLDNKVYYTNYGSNYVAIYYPDDFVTAYDAQASDEDKIGDKRIEGSFLSKDGKQVFINGTKSVTTDDASTQDGNVSLQTQSVNNSLSLNNTSNGVSSPLDDTDPTTPTTTWTIAIEKNDDGTDKVGEQNINGEDEWQEGFNYLRKSEFVSVDGDVYLRTFKHYDFGSPFNGIGNADTYVSEAKSAAHALSLFIFGQTVDWIENAKAWYTLMTPIYKDNSKGNEILSLEFQLAASKDGSNNYSLTYPFKYHFGDEVSDSKYNPAKAEIEAFIESYNGSSK